MNLAWITDPHLNFLNEDKIKQQLILLKYKTECNDLLITGDIAESDSIEWALTHLSKYFESIYFILGNHDYWGSSIAEVRRNVEKFSSGFSNLYYMDGKIKGLTSDTCVVGCNSFYDGRNGQATDIFGNPIVKLHDWQYIKEFQGKSFLYLFDAIQDVAEQYAQEAKEILVQACKEYKRVILLTHVPPFHQAVLRDVFFLPWYSSKIMGDVISEVASEFPSTEIHVLSGHSHYFASYQHFDNLTAHVGVADYGKLFVSGIISPFEKQIISTQIDIK